MKLTQRDFGKGMTLYTLTNKNGLELEATDFGARIVNFYVPVDGEKRNISLGFESAEEYMEKDTFIGATIGRTAGRIAEGKFAIDGVSYQAIVDSENGHSLHGGQPSFDSQQWQVKTELSDTEGKIHFSLVSKDGENGFPGTLEVTVTYTLTEENEWKVEYQAHTDKATLFNPTNHVYFNLTGDHSQTIDEHQLKLAVNRFAPVTEAVLTTGERRAVEGTAFDFREEKKLGQAINSDEEQVAVVKGFDHPFFLENQGFEAPEATLISPDKKVKLEMFTDQSAVVIFTSNFGGGGPVMRGKQVVDHGGLTFETQAVPGAERFSSFDADIVLRPEKDYRSTTIYKVSVQG